MDTGMLIFTILAFIALIIFTVLFLSSRYRRCPSDQILIIYGWVGKGRSNRTIHGGGTFVWPLIQDYAYMSLTPMTIPIPLENALSLQNIRIHVPSTFTVGISTDPALMSNAAERLLRLKNIDIEGMAKEIIFGQLRLTVASLTIEQINQDRESFLEAVRHNVEPELNKIGLHLINVNITDITDESDYIESIGKKAASEAINKARVDVAEQDKLGAVGEAAATRDREIQVAEALAEAEKGRKRAVAGQRIFVQDQEAQAVEGENAATARIASTNANLEIQKADAHAESEKGRKRAEAGQRIFVQDQEAQAIEGENNSKARIAAANADLAIQQADAKRKAEVAQREAEAKIQQAQYEAELQRLRADQIVRQEVEKQKIEIAAEAEAERIRREARGTADSILMRYEAEAEGTRKLLEAKANGYQKLVESCQGDANAAATLLLIEKMEELVARQVEAVKNLKIDRITVWDGASSEGSTTANFISGLVKTLPPLHDIAGMAGVELPGYLGKVSDQTEKQPAAPQKKEKPGQPDTKNE